MSDLLKHVIITLTVCVVLTFAVSYLSTAFITTHFDFALWKEEDRANVILLAIFAGLPLGIGMLTISKLIELNE